MTDLNEVQKVWDAFLWAFTPFPVGGTAEEFLNEWMAFLDPTRPQPCTRCGRRLGPRKTWVEGWMCGRCERQVQNPLTGREN
jgi:hypothetical protein